MVSSVVGDLERISEKVVNIISKKKNFIEKNNFIPVYHDNLVFDFSRQHINASILSKLIQLSEECGLRKKINGLFEGQGGSLHIQLRSQEKNSKKSDDELYLKINNEKKRMLAFATKVRSKKLKGWTGKPITNVIVLGLGGSVLGPKFVIESVDAEFKLTTTTLYFASNPDGFELKNTLLQSNPEKSLIIIQSKSLTTPELYLMFSQVKQWFEAHSCPKFKELNQMAVVTSNIELALKLGFLQDTVFWIPKFVGGRFSVWSSIGLPVAIAIGRNNYNSFLEGAADMDQHFLLEKASTNIPLLAALIAIWNQNFLKFKTQHVATYSSKLDFLIQYIQQLEMESLGKSLKTDGSPCLTETSAIVWGGSGIQGQHAYFQLLHQGTSIVPIDFYGLHPSYRVENRAEKKGHNFLCENLKVQADALAFGDPKNNFPGNRPSSIIWLKELSPSSLGGLMSLLEHKVFTMGILWGINPFDQPGVELGKKMLKK
ncbi:MAG: hypothetical protein CBC42_01735 [Betaproteobacteria bacterium TMED82]|nr:MAG: hypothetical protein CBC42_01735 [Betaproteobacteria bacterium TMED82]|tara:strand:- start:2054 stop:3511 length:1458 start_codon:yes stop_codon:yes gene_type:complete